MLADYYELLGVARTAGADEIKRAYRRLAREHHPDMNQGDREAEARFKEVAEAYEVLADPGKRQRYDMFGHAGVGMGGPGGAEAGFGGIGDIFDAFFGDAFGFGARGRGQGPGAGADIVAEAEISFEQAVFGTSIDLEIQAMVACGDCRGSGAEPGTRPSRCRHCGGTGELRDVRRTFLGSVITAHPCAACGGTGEEIGSPCPGCGGEGRVLANRSLTVEAPAGVEHGSQLRQPGAGHMGRRGAPPGDLYITLRVRPHAVLKRKGDDLVYLLEISVAQAALGTVIDVPTLDGDQAVAVEPGTQPGALFRLKGMGVPKIRGRGRGDLLIPVKVVVPDKLTDEETELLRRLAELRGDEVRAADQGLKGRVKSAFKGS